MAVKFTSGGTTIYLRNPVRGNLYSNQKAHAVGRSAAGTLYSYYKGIQLKNLKMEFDNLSNSEKTTLDSFFDTTVVGPSNTFTLVDHQGTSWTARFINDKLDFTEVYDESNGAITFYTGTEVYPTTLRKNPVWKVELEFEVS